MIRLIVFLTTLAGLIYALTLDSYKSQPVVKERFDLAKTEQAFKVQQELILALNAPKEEVEEEEEEAFVEYEPIVELSTPQLEKGKRLYGQCISCHGKGGEGKDSQKAPHIGGQYNWYIEKQLNDMKTGARINVAMEPVVKALSPQDVKDVSAYISKLPWNKEKYLAEQKAAAKK